MNRSIALALLLPALLPATSNFSFTGTFQSDTDIQFITFTLANPSNVILRTWSYAGGTNAAGDPIANGGFEPVLNLFDSTGQQMNTGTSGPCTSPLTGDPIVDLIPDPTTGACSDVYYPTTRSFPGGSWTPGTYTIALTEVGNESIGNLSDGFFAIDVLGTPPGTNYTCSIYQGSPPTVPTDQPFCDAFASGVQRDGHWALDIYNVDSASTLDAVPEPGAAALVLFGTIVLLLRAYAPIKWSTTLRRCADVRCSNK